MDATTEVLQSEEVTYVKPSPDTQPDENKVNSNDRVNSQDDTEGSQENAGNNASNNKTLQEAQELVEKCKEVYHVHKLDQAIKYLKQFEELKDSLNNEDLEAYMKIVTDEQILFDQIHDEYDYLMRIDKELESHESWKEDQVSQNLKVFYKTAENGLLIAKIEALVDVGLLPIISMINEVELWKLWNAFMNHTTEVKTLHRAAKVYYVEYGLPYPLSNREIHLYGVGVNRLHDNGTVMILAKSIDNDDAFFEKHDFKKVVHNGTINIDVNLGAFEIKPLGREKCILRGVANLNPKFDWVPQKILNWVIRKGTKQMVEKIIAGAKTFKGSPWEKEIHKEHKKDFYDWLQVQLEEYYVVHEAKPAEEESK